MSKCTLQVTMLIDGKYRRKQFTFSADGYRKASTLAARVGKRHDDGALVAVRCAVNPAGDTQDIELLTCRQGTCFAPATKGDARHNRVVSHAYARWTKTALAGAKKK